MEAKYSKVQAFFEEKFMMIADKIGNQRHLIAIRDGLMMSMPLLIIGSTFIIISELPIQAYQNFMLSVFGKNWQKFEDVAVNGTIGIISLIAVFGIAYSLARTYQFNDNSIDGIPAGVLSVSAFFIVNVVNIFGEGDKAVKAWNTGLFTSKYLFVAIIVAVITSEMYRLMIQKNFVITMPKTIPPAVTRSFSALLPGAVIIVFFMLIRLAFAFTQWNDFSTFVLDVLKKPIEIAGSSYIGTIFACFVEHILWTFGIHGSSIMTTVMEPVWLSNSAENLELFRKGVNQLPHIVTYTFYENGVWIGGSGATLSAVIYMLLFSKSKQMKQVGNFAIIPSIFNINEPVIFGLPVVLNPFFMIPYIFAPIAVTTVSYFGIKFGIFPYTAGIILPWTTPYFISGYLMSGGKLMGVAAQIVSFLVAFSIWFPFIWLWDKKQYQTESSQQPHAL